MCQALCWMPVSHQGAAFWEAAVFVGILSDTAETRGPGVSH